MIFRYWLLNGLRMKPGPAHQTKWNLLFTSPSMSPPIFDSMLRRNQSVTRNPAASVVPTSASLAFFATDRGGALLALFGSVATSFIAAGVADGPHTVSQVISAAFLFLITNQALFAVLKKLIAPTGPELAEEVVVESQATGQQVQANADQSAQAAADALNSVGK